MKQKGALVTISIEGTRRLVDDPIFYKYCIHETDNTKSLYLCSTTLYSIHSTEVHKLTNILMYCTYSAIMLQYLQYYYSSERTVLVEYSNIILEYVHYYYVAVLTVPS